MALINDMADFLDDETIDWQNGLAHLADANFDSIYNPQHHLHGQSQHQQQVGRVKSSGNAPPIEQQQQQPEESDETKLSDALIYGPRFCQVFREYTETLGKPVNVDRHLMSLCTEHLVPFCKWARENEAKTTSIRGTLLEFDYLRPEVRNGIVMVIIYTFASIKATRENGLDMFITLQDTEKGLGIANKFSLKIYNDPFMYLSFLKISISALIDAGAIPDNERINQPKRNKAMVENKEELDAYDQIQRRLVSLLDSGDNAGAKHIVLLITNYWQQRAKFIRNRRFVSVLHALAVVPAPVSSLAMMNNQQQQQQQQQQQLLSGSGGGGHLSNQSSHNNLSTLNHTHVTGEINRNPQCHAMNTTSPCCGACGQNPSGQQSTSVASEDEKSALMAKRMRPNPPSEGGMGGNGMDKSANDSNKGAVHPETAPGLSTSHYHFPTGRRCSPRPIDALRFERVGTHEWSIVETKVYDVCEFMKMLALDMGDTPVCLIDESMLQQSAGFLPKKLSTQIGLGGIGYKSTNDGVMSLTKELTLNNSMITSWTKADRPQLREMACQWQWQKQLPASDVEGDSGSKDETMITFWRSNDTTDFSLGRNSCQGADSSHPCGGGGGAGCHNSCGGCSGTETHDDHNEGYANGSSHLDEYSVNKQESYPITVPFTVGVPMSQQNLIENALYSNGQALRQRPHAQHSNPYSNHISQPHIQHVKKQPKGYLVYEQTLQVGVVVRANPAMGLMEDLWCVLFPTELNPLTNTESFGVFLSRLFPQLKALYGREEQSMSGRMTTDSIRKAEFITAVKYYPHQKGHTLNHPPMAPDNSQCYRTVGTVSIAASILLARIAEGPTFHEFLLSPIM